MSAGRSASGAALPSSALPSQAFLAAVPADSREAPSPGREPRQGVVGRGCKDLYTVSETVAEATGQGGRRQRLKRRLGVYHAAPAGWNPTDRWTTARLCERGSRTLSGPCFGTFLEPLAGARHRPREIPGTYEVDAVATNSNRRANFPAILARSDCDSICLSAAGRKGRGSVSAWNVSTSDRARDRR